MIQIGDIVECVKPHLGHDRKPCPRGFYTVRGLVDEHGVYLEEIVNRVALSHWNDGIHVRELGYLITRFKKVQFPPSLSTEISEALERELVLVDSCK